MNRIIRVVLILVILVLVGGVAALAMLDLPAPTQHVEKIITNVRQH
jgi:Na+/H+ antiporter NhaC